MSVRRLSLVAVLAACVAAAFAAPSGATDECRGILVCIRVPGPWVAVPASGEAQYLLECPRRRGVVGGLDAQATGRDVVVTFDGLLGSPVAPGTTTGRDAFFRASSTKHTAGMFQPLLGCIPAGGGGQRSTTSAVVTRPGLPVEHRARTVKLGPGSVRRISQGCARGERLVGGWHALAFRTPRPPSAGAASLVRIQRTISGRTVRVAVFSSEGVQTSLRAEVQVGAICAR
jgi:hypothetical protein